MAITISGQNNNDKILASDGVLDSISGFNVVGVMTASTFDVSGKLTANHLNIGSNINFGNAGIITATTLIGNVTGNVIIILIFFFKLVAVKNYVLQIVVHLD